MSAMAPMLAETNVTGIVLLSLGALLVLVSVAVVALRNRSRRRAPEVPYGMRPGPSDTALETPLLNRYQGWGVLVVAFLVVWFPIIWLLEPDTNFRQEEDLRTIAADRGARAVLPFSEENQFGVGCTQCHGPELKGGIIQAGGSYAYPPNLTDICEGNLNGAHPQIATTDDIYQVIYEGRNAMPSWSIRYRGALTDQQINDLVVYLIELSSENVAFEDNICLNPDAEERAIEKAIADGTVLERP
jgi:mono/diheme cytochrome c family protein